MNELAVVNKGADWHRLKALVLDGVLPDLLNGFTIEALERVFRLVRAGAAARLHQGDRGRLGA